ncbi:hypothetical protein ACIPVK_19175 [Paeniglutamicibacter sp. MACA_103]|uniref:hypothetical protein n=1 Tax=Paeniglutamicibacter sp. MACA_103 TaxID=3377337 RepID=UPI0038959421
MRTVTVSKDALVATLQTNRANHRKVFEEALEGYLARLLRELERRVHDLRRGRKISAYISLPEPEDHTDDYDRILTMAVMSVDTTFTLSEEDFGMYVMDQWDWKRSFNDSTARYI